jgi:hypothetical protein
VRIVYYIYEFFPLSYYTYHEIQLYHLNGPISQETLQYVLIQILNKHNLGNMHGGGCERPCADVETKVSQYTYGLDLI